MQGTLTDTLDKVAKLHTTDVKLEVIGSWIWASGNTRPHKDFFKSLGFKFSGKKAAWFWHAGTFRKKSKRDWSLPEIRHTFGVEELQTA